ncbi:hypothetical protein ACIOGT_24635 [Streptomyces microflavus]|uniref:hypothetical protein n=1 Tax=Streptomyces microflavus TaxID=1919 RepID=UPI00382CC068
MLFVETAHPAKVHHSSRPGDGVAVRDLHSDRAVSGGLFRGWRVVGTPISRVLAAAPDKTSVATAADPAAFAQSIRLPRT